MKVLIPCATLVYFFALTITSGYLYETILGFDPEELGRRAIISMSLINAIMLATTTAWLAMPKRPRICRGETEITNFAPKLLAGVVQHDSRSRRIRRPY